MSNSSNFHTIIAKKGGKLISTYHINGRAYAAFTCENGHKVRKRIDCFHTWCFQCTKNTIADAHKLAEKRGGKFLSEKYVNANTKYKWQCKEGHIFISKYGNVHTGKWCQICHDNETRYTLDDLQKIVTQKQGKVIHPVNAHFVKASDKVTVQCKFEHEWTTVLQSIAKGSWCGICNVGMSERTCRCIFEFLYEKPFVKQRPEWLLSEEGTRIELDGYNEELKVAFEYNGKQHYENVQYFRGSELSKRQSSDKQKVKLCTENNVELIVIPYTIAYKDLYKYIREQCKKWDKPENIEYDLLGVEVLSRHLEVEKYVREKYNAVMLSQYFNNFDQIKFRCKNNHDFEQTWASITAGIFCKKCTYLRIQQKYTKIVREFCNDKNIKLVSEYKTAKEKIVLQYKDCEHTFESTWNSLRDRPKKFHRCSLCCPEVKKIKKINEEYIQSKNREVLKFCEDKNLKMISKYKNSTEKITFGYFSCDHTFTTTWDGLIRKPHFYCTTCSPRYTQYAEQFCKKNNIKMLTPFKSAIKKMTFQFLHCSHIFEQRWDTLHRNPNIICQECK